MQYNHRKSAYKQLETMMSERLERLEGEEFSPGELFLAKILISHEEEREENKKFQKKVEQLELGKSKIKLFGGFRRKAHYITYKRLRSFGRVLGVYPVTEELKNTVRVTEKILGHMRYEFRDFRYQEIFRTTRRKKGYKWDQYDFSGQMVNAREDFRYY